MKYPTFDRFDIVNIKTTRNIKFLSGPDGHVASPQGNWSIVGFIANEALLAKDQTVIKVPIRDIRLAARLNTQRLLDKLGASGGEKDN